MKNYYLNFLMEKAVGKMTADVSALQLLLKLKQMKIYLNWNPEGTGHLELALTGTAGMI